MLTVYDDADEADDAGVLVLDPVAEEALVPDAGALDAELEVDAADEAAACAAF
ncbi:hypothetical protein FSO04_22600 [Paraburkholderia madseniana]|jgi:hypothetical protein|uniref:Uncharacterized protein n=1 Tax=Paraburkholderia madseniana TaxID=2599607 RepID=A0A6N6WDX7_9BURK|nr:hypothetical protein [Paraburkholderia madseniana]KAE8757690.1 hypothetical protein FSO04_22600 [Paraburkholderia madseniana]